MKKPTTSDQLKQAFATALHTDPDDWKRGAKSKNDEGLWVREFENKKNGDIVAAIELEDGRFLCKKEGWSETITLASEQFSKKAAAPLSQPEIMYGPIANEAADKAIAIIMNDEQRAETEDEDFEGSEWGVPKKLLDDAGKALANRHCFAICGEDDSLTAMITPIRYYKEEGCCSDQSGPVGHLLPKCAEAMESTWECYEKGVKTPADFAKYLQAQGFQWSRDFQDYIDGNLTKTLSKQIAAMEDEPSPREAAQQVMKVVLDGNEEGNDEIPAWLLKKADPKELAGNFYFTVYDMRNDDGDLVAVVAPKGKGTDDSKKSYSVMYHLFPEVQYIDDCVEGWWAFPANVDTPLKLAQKLVDAGFEYNAEYQDDALKPQLAGLKLPAAAKPDAPKP
jgi:hypothetical protein